MSDSKNYMHILQDSLRSKSALLGELLELSEEQYQSIKKETPDMEAFDRCMDKKEVRIDKLTELDNGFQLLYNRVKALMEQEKELYRDDILRIQELIREVTDKSVKVEAAEKRNKREVEHRFGAMRKELKSSQNAALAASKYNSNMNRVNKVDPQLLDAKK